MRSPPSRGTLRLLYTHRTPSRRVGTHAQGPGMPYASGMGKGRKRGGGVTRAACVHKSPPLLTFGFAKAILSPPLACLHSVSPPPNRPRRAPLTSDSYVQKPVGDIHMRSSTGNAVQNLLVALSVAGLWLIVTAAEPQDGCARHCFAPVQRHRTPHTGHHRGVTNSASVLRLHSIFSPPASRTAGTAPPTTGTPTSTGPTTASMPSPLAPSASSSASSPSASPASSPPWPTRNL